MAPVFTAKLNHMFAYVKAWFKQERVALAGIVILGLVLRLVNLGVEPYWGDEVLSLDIAKHFAKIPDLIAYLKVVEVHPPLYYFMLHYWIAWLGTGEFAVRFLSLLFGLGVIVMGYYLARSLFPRVPQIALWAALLIAVLPFQVEYSQEARPYIIFCFFALVQAYATWHWLRSRQVGYLILYLVAGTIGLYLHYSFAYVVMALASWWLVMVFRDKARSWSRSFTIWLAAQAALFVLFFWWLSTFIYKLFLIGSDPLFGVIRGPAAGVRPLVLFESIIDQLVWLSQHQPVEVVVLVAITVFKIVAVGFLTAWIVRRRLKIPVPPAHGGPPLALLGCLFLVPLVLFLFSPGSIPYTVIYERHIIVSSVAFAILLAFLLAQLPVKQRLALFFLFFATIIPSLTLVLGDDSLWNPDFRLREMGSYITEYYRPGDLVVTESVFTRTDLNHFLRPPLGAVGFYPPGNVGQDYLSSRETLGFIENEMQFRNWTLDTAEVYARFDQLIRYYRPRRVWLVYFGEYELATQTWFSSHGWRQAITAPDKLFPVDLYAMK